MANDHDEIGRLRTRVHEISNFIQKEIMPKLATLDDRVKHVEEDLQEHVDKYEPKVDALIRSDEILAAIKGQRRLELTWVQRLGALVLFSLGVADFIARIFH